MELELIEDSEERTENSLYYSAPESDPKDAVDICARARK